jgi:hypothetical protein
MKYVVHMAVDGRIDLEVEAENPDAAYDEALAAFGNADLSQVEVVAGMPMYCEDGTGTIVKEY